MGKFWKKILEKEVKHNKQAEWLREEEIAQENLQGDEWREFEEVELKNTIKVLQNWKSPGIDKIHNFWLKYLVSLHGQLISGYNEIIKNPINIPEWMTKGITYLLPKSKDTLHPKNYRPITCLPVIYKILTSLISERIYSYLQKNNILPEEQKGCRKKSRGCKDQLLVSQMVMQHAKKFKKISPLLG